MGMDDDRAWRLREQYEEALREGDAARIRRLRLVYGNDEGVGDVFDQCDKAHQDSLG